MNRTREDQPGRALLTVAWVIAAVYLIFIAWLFISAAGEDPNTRHGSGWIAFSPLVEAKIVSVLAAIPAGILFLFFLLAGLVRQHHFQNMPSSPVVEETYAQQYQRRLRKRRHDDET